MIIATRDLLDRTGIRDAPVNTIVRTTRDVAMIRWITEVIVAVTTVSPETVEPPPPGVE